jgi:hypothetical protein
MPTLLKAPKGTWNLTRSWKLKVISCSKCQKKMDFYVGICKKMSEYCILMVKMVLDYTNNNSIKVNFELLYDIKVLYGLAAWMPLLGKVNNIMKLA